MIFRHKFTLLTVLAIIVFGASLYSAPKTVSYMGKTYVYLQEIAKVYGMTMTTNQTSCTLRNNVNYMRFEFNKKTATINGIKVSLLLPAAIQKGTPIIGLKDYYYVLDPIFNKKALKRQYIRTIILDPGHGGEDNGTHGLISKEKNVALAITRKVASILTASGYKVVMTRNSDKTISLESRVEVISRYDGDVFVSIHCNSAKKDITGYETFVLAPQGTSSTYSNKIVYKYEKGNHYDKNNEKLGYEINKALSRTGRTDRGLKHARFAVLKYASKPATLVEVGFLSNPYEERLLNSNAYQDKVARAIATGIISFGNAASKGN